jgi:hypothetical protein
VSSAFCENGEKNRWIGKNASQRVSAGNSFAPTGAICQAEKRKKAKIMCFFAFFFFS